MDLKGIKYEGVEQTGLVQDRVQWPALVDTIINHRVP
jgi:hypothetical protein